jgi:hypothetical protein
MLYFWNAAITASLIYINVQHSQTAGFQNDFGAAANGYCRGILKRIRW